MNKKYPKRITAHNLEELSERYFISHLPDNWYSDKSTHDYGVDLNVEIIDGENATGLELLVQLKSSENGSNNKNEPLRLKVSTYNYLKGKLQVVLLVKYIRSENSAYWILLKDIPAPNQENESFTINIPKENRLSEINWKMIQEFVAEITDQKLASIHAKEQQATSNQYVDIKSAKGIAHEKIKIYKYKRIKENFNSSFEGVQKTEKEIRNLVNCFKKLSDELRDPESGIYLKFDYQEDNIRKIIELINRNHILRVEWFNDFTNSLHSSGLGIWLTKNFRHFDDYGDKGETILHQIYFSNLDLNNNIGWSELKENKTIKSSIYLADYWIGQLLSVGA